MTRALQQRTLEKLATAFGMSVAQFRGALGLHGPLHAPPLPPVADPEDILWSPRAERIAGLVESLPLAEQEFIETLCAYFRLRRGIDLPPAAAVPPR